MWRCGLRPGVNDAKKVLKVLEPNFKDLSAEQKVEVMEVAKAVTEVAFEAYEAKARYMVFGQVHYNGEYLDADDYRAAKVGLGPFPTLKQAQAAGESLAYSSATGEESRWAAVGLYYGTPSAWYRERLKERQNRLDGASEGTPARELRHRHIQEWLEAHPGETILPEHLQGNGWESLERYMQWREEHMNQCPACEGTGRIKES